MGKFDTDVCDSCGRPRSEITTTDPRREHVEFSGISFPPGGAGFDKEGNVKASILAEFQFPIRKPETVEDRACSTPTCKEGIKSAEQSLEELNDSLEDVCENNSWSELSEIDLNRAKTVVEDFRESFEHEGRIHNDPQILQQRQQMFEDRVGEQIQRLEDNIQNIEQKQENLEKIEAFSRFTGESDMSEINDIRSSLSDVNNKYQNAIQEARTDVETDTEQTADSGMKNDENVGTSDSSGEVTAGNKEDSNPDRDNDVESEIERATPDSAPSSGTGTDTDGPGSGPP